MELPRFIQSILNNSKSALNTIWTDYGSKIFRAAFWFFAIGLGLILSGAIGTGIVILGVILAPFAILFSPILVPLGIVAGWVALAVLGIVLWKKMPLVLKAIAQIINAVYYIYEQILGVLQVIGKILRTILVFFEGIYRKVIQWLSKGSKTLEDDSPENKSKVPATPPKVPQGSDQDVKAAAAAETEEKIGRNQREISSSRTPQKSSPEEEDPKDDDSFHSPQCHPLPAEEPHFQEANNGTVSESDQPPAGEASRSSAATDDLENPTSESMSTSTDKEFVFVESKKKKTTTTENGAGTRKSGANGHGHGHQDQPSSWSDFKENYGSPGEEDVLKSHPDTPVPNPNNKQNKNRRKKQQQQHQKHSK